ncbi:carotenoid biosynthesis protein [Geomonas sp. Red69]|uniref:Carotenoid biosynthesis protein n=1 Tax=Geomonas diazotrophica TaxID=2843197 RepID=A0ABX8JMV0_9BACT|nr:MULTISPECIES: carotenoid biosynthesis protein [Geomonas]MBU5637001.1 carotenoid biosynthesis protein [Geomonas diazotrophica]QWV98897.1 carotenoid biosynthesis protein [Geomonas nitrogeniifigens]
MTHILDIAVGTVIMRPYVFAFFAVYLVAAVLHLGWKKTILFTVCGYLVAFASEFSSINNGFPYGWYYYVDVTRDRELWIAGVPFFDSLSYVFLTYCSYATALFVLAPVKRIKGDLVLLETGRLRRSFAVLLLGSLFQVFLDIVTDPVALQGSRWFLGRIYGYREVGTHFGIPMSNYLGWWLVSALLVLVLQSIDRIGSGKGRPAGVGAAPYRALYGPFLYLCVIAFNLGVTFYIGENLMGLTGVFIFTLPVVMTLVLFRQRLDRYHKDELADHLADYPWSPAGSGAAGRVTDK